MGITQSDEVAMEWVAALQEFFVIVYGPVVMILMVMLIGGGVIYGVLTLILEIFYE